MSNVEKVFVTSICDRLEGIDTDVRYLLENENSNNKDKLIWVQAKVNDLMRLMNQIK